MTAKQRTAKAAEELVEHVAPVTLPGHSRVPPVTFIDTLLGTYGAEPDPFEITLPKGEVLKFRSLSSYAELSQFKKAAGVFAKRCRDGHIAPQFKGLLPNDDEAALVAFTIMELSVEPKFDEQAALKLLKAPWLCEFIMGEIDRNRMAYIAQGADPVGEAKKD